MNTLDLVLIGFVLLGTLGGLAAGFVKSAATLAGLVLGFVFGSALFPAVAPYLLRWTGELSIASLLGFTLVALVAVLLLESVGNAATAAVQRLHLQFVNRPLGLLPAAASTVLIAGVTLALLNGFSVLESEREESRLSRWILQVSEPLVELLPPPWNGAPQPLPPQPIPASDAPAMARASAVGFRGAASLPLRPSATRVRSPRRSPSPVALATARSARRSEPVIRSASSPIGGERAARADSDARNRPNFLLTTFRARL